MATVRCPLALHAVLLLTLCSRRCLERRSSFPSSRRQLRLASISQTHQTLLQARGFKALSLLMWPSLMEAANSSRRRATAGPPTSASSSSSTYVGLPLVPLVPYFLLFVALSLSVPHFRAKLFYVPLVLLSHASLC